ncbi:lipoyl(octanoyl) transferase LipB [Candidatus Enterovibrio altilux]|uniref:Octanoyltransferase n=1 Tax=Candidatus Enterovibrio altilux TaxID=1927128 RepID=A0A291BA39_9GAMM|nr:lipoyl(octanoyl) transferase LipB [Candidatus Enterovibrio luxaltus]ATF09888.1 Octanoate-[acyl-carrier-protein]-protein-N-octan oyltransferase [Candidatus Enterovibrio luxaltus]
MQQNRLTIRQLGLQPYAPILLAMHTFTDERNSKTCDEIWLVEHEPVFTQGQAGKAEHLLATGDIKVVQSDRGGQVTYHGPGQQVVYVLIDLKRNKIRVRELVTHIEQIVIDTLTQFNIESHARHDAPGVYVGDNKICSLGLRIRRGCSFHGLALNVNMDLSPFLRINPCGYTGLVMTQTIDLGGPASLVALYPVLIDQLTSHLGYDQIESLTENY